jgi:hypothetical protein
MARHVIANQQAEFAVGLVLLAGGAYLLHDAVERRGRSQPWWMRPISFW